MMPLVRSALEGAGILAMSIAGAIVYGIAHDLITTRICLEYFTIGHPPVWGGTHDPTVLAFTWGVIATWWAGAIIGIPLALAAQVGRLPRRSAASMVRPIVVLLCAMAAIATAAGIVSFEWYRNPAGALLDPLTSGIPIQAQPAFMVDLWIHLASYGAGFFGGIVLIGWVLVRRYRAEVKRRLEARGLGDPVFAAIVSQGPRA